MAPRNIILNSMDKTECNLKINKIKCHTVMSQGYKSTFNFVVFQGDQMGRFTKIFIMKMPTLNF